MVDLNDDLTSPGLTGQRGATETLARETNRPIEDIQEIYTLERANLERTARVKTFIPVLVNRRVKNILQSQRHGPFQQLR
jgi:hypothetical protein